MRRRAKQEKRQPRRQPQQLQLQEKAQAAGVRVRSRASAARRDAPKTAEEPEYKKVYKPRVRFDSQWLADYMHDMPVLPLAGGQMGVKRKATARCWDLQAV